MSSSRFELYCISNISSQNILISETFDGVKFSEIFSSDRRIIGSIQSKVRKQSCHFNSFDMHIQYSSQNKDPSFFAIVVEIDSSGFIENHDVYRLTNAGMNAVKSCVSSPKPSKSLEHPPCIGENLYASIAYDVIDAKNPYFTILHPQQFKTIGYNIRKRKRNVSTRKSEELNLKTPKISISEDKPKLKKQIFKQRCKNCNKECSLLSHLAKAKACKEKYNDEEYKHLIDESKSRKKDYIQDYRKKNKEAISENCTGMVQ